MNWKKVNFDTLESTNKTAQEYDIFSVISAKTQTGGRGRYGKNWVSPVGNLYMSAVLPDYGDKTPFLTFVVAVSVVEAFKGYNVRLKWPNDALLNGQKLAGILLERVDDKIIVGIGVNLVSHPTILDKHYRATDLGGVVPVDVAMDAILNKLDENLQIFENQGFLPIRNKWKSYAIGLNAPIAVNFPTHTLTGIFRDLSVSGALLLEQPDKTITEITAGVVFLLE